MALTGMDFAHIFFAIVIILLSLAIYACGNRITCDPSRVNYK